MSSPIRQILTNLNLYQREGLTPDEIAFLFPELIEAEQALIAYFLSVRPEKKPLQTDIDGDPDEVGTEFCLECGQYAYEGVIDCICMGFNDALDQWEANIKGGKDE